METPQSYPSPAEERAYAEAAKEIGASIALGLVPFLAQAIDIYDTVESIWRIQGAKTLDTKEDAKFDLILALVGWVPGPGDGVKKSLRLVNKDPQRFAPILFDLLRRVCEIANIKTSPEVLLEKLFDARMLASQIGEIRAAILESSPVKQLSPESQQTIRVTLNQIEHELPAWVGIVQKRIVKWKKVQRNSSAQAAPMGKKKTDALSKDKQVAENGRDRPEHANTNQVKNSVMASAEEQLENALAGVLGEHIADYYCSEKLGWGKHWQGHDKGAQGKWTNGTPNGATLGKVSNVKNRHVLFTLEGAANDKGIDSVWRVDSKNQGKPYAIVEAKSDQELNVPGFVKRNPNTARKPGVGGKLRVTGIPKGEDLLETEPPEMEGDTDKPASKKRGGKTGRKGGGKSTKGEAAKRTNKKDEAAPSSQKPTDPPKKNRILVQMSHAWIDKNMLAAVGSILRRDALASYSRHLIYTPQWLASAQEHAKALRDGTAHDGSTHTNHDVNYPGGLGKLHYEEREVKVFVNRKKAFLRKKHGDLPTLKAET